MDSRRHFLRGLARAATGAGRPAEPAPGPPERIDPPPGPGTPQDDAGAGPAPVSESARRYTGAGWDDGARERLQRSAVLVVGAGALGTPVLTYLAGAGVGRLGVLDGADVALDDLHAEPVHYTPDVGVPKAHSAAAKLGFLNPEIVIEPYAVQLDAGNAEGLLAGQDLVVDCSNDARTQDVVAAECARLGVPLVAAGASARGGWVVSVPSGEHACRTCAGAHSPEDPDVLPGTAAGVIGSLQAREALSRAGAPGEHAAANTLHVALDAPGLRRVALVRRPDCAACGAR